MRLYFTCKECSKKVYLDSNATSRAQLAKEWGENFSIPCGSCGNTNVVHVNQVFAETSTDASLTATVSGTLAGFAISTIVATPISSLLFVGGILGKVIGSRIDNNDGEKVQFFNKSNFL